MKLIQVEHSVSHTSTNTCNSVAFKNLTKIVKYLEHFTKVYSIIAFCVVHSCWHQDCFISLCCAV